MSNNLNIVFQTKADIDKDMNPLSSCVYCILCAYDDFSAITLYETDDIIEFKEKYGGMTPQELLDYVLENTDNGFEIPVEAGHPVYILGKCYSISDAEQHIIEDDKDPLKGYGT